MKAILPAVVLGWLVIGGSPAGSAEERKPATVEDVVAVFEKTVGELESESAVELGKLRTETVAKLQSVQDRLCRDAKLDEAVAVRDTIRSLRSQATKTAVAADLPPDAGEILTTYQMTAEAAEQKLARRIQTEGEGAAERLQPLLDRLCREAKLDDALAVREVIRRLKGEVIAEVKPDPGYLRAGESDIGQVWFFEVTGANTGSCYGTDIYTSDSSLTAAAVHTGALELGEKGVVKVTILPGQSEYPSSTRHGITSSHWSSWGVSFKVERVRSYQIRSATKISATAGTMPDRNWEIRPKPEREVAKAAGPFRTGDVAPEVKTPGAEPVAPRAPAPLVPTPPIAPPAEPAPPALQTNQTPNPVP
jgi:hypothetical protein